MTAAAPRGPAPAGHRPPNPGAGADDISPRFLALLAAEGLARHRVLDVGCGSGRLALRLAPGAGHVVGLDRDAETLGMEICLPVWQHRDFIDGHRYDHTQVTTLLLVTTEETRLEDLLARKVATGDIGATANTILLMGSERMGSRLARMLCVVKHRGSGKSDEIVEYRVGARGLEFA